MNSNDYDHIKRLLDEELNSTNPDKKRIKALVVISGCPYLKELMTTIIKPTLKNLN